MKTMQQRVAAFFSPSITLRWRGLKGKRGPFFYPDTLHDEPLLRQFMGEAGLDNKNGVRVSPDQYDAVLAAAGKHDYSITCIGGPEDDQPGT